MTARVGMRSVLAVALPAACMASELDAECVLPRIEGVWLDTGATSDKEVMLTLRDAGTNGALPVLAEPIVESTFMTTKHRCPHPAASGKPFYFLPEFFGSMEFHPERGSQGEWEIVGKLQVCLYDRGTQTTESLWWADLHFTTVSDTRLHGTYVDHDGKFQDITLIRTPETALPPARDCNSAMQSPGPDETDQRNSWFKQLVEDERARAHGGR